MLLRHDAGTRLPRCRHTRAAYAAAATLAARFFMPMARCFDDDAVMLLTLRYIRCCFCFCSLCCRSYAELPLRAETRRAITLLTPLSFTRYCRHYARYFIYATPTPPLFSLYAALLLPLLRHLLFRLMMLVFDFSAIIVILALLLHDIHITRLSRLRHTPCCCRDVTRLPL